MDFCQRGLFIGAVLTLAAALGCSSKTPDLDGGNKDMASAIDTGGGLPETAPDMAAQPDIAANNDTGGGQETGSSELVTGDLPVIVDTAGPDLGGGDASAACPFQFCEDFESDKSGMPPNPARWTQDGTTVIVDGVKPHKGTLGLHVLPHVGGTCSDTAANCPAARFARITDAFPPALHKQHYGRMWFWIERTPTDTQYYHWMVMEANASTRYAGGLALRQGGEMPAGGPVTGGVAKNYMLTHIDTHNKTDNPFETERGRVQTQTPLTNKTWYCLEWFIDATAQKARYWLDGNQRAGLDWNGPIANQPQFNLPAEFKSMAFGLRVFQVSTQQFEVFIDDIALDSKQIGCN